MAHCERCRGEVYEPVRALPNLCRDCGQEEVLNAVNVNPIRGMLSCESTGSTSVTMRPTSLLILGSCALGIAVVIAWAFVV